MTNWQPDISRVAGPRAQAIAETLARDISEGRLKAGERLPTHRDLAWRLNVSIGTVTRAYAEAERRGLVTGEVGRGTYVKETGPTDPLRPRPSEDQDSIVDLSHNYPPLSANRAEIGAVMEALAKSRALGPLLGYQPDLGRHAHRAAAVRWLSLTGMPATEETVMLTNGAQDALHLSLAALTRPGDTVLTEDLTFYGIKSVAPLLSLRLAGVAMDRDGLIPDALDAACRATGAKALYVIPTLHNPTTAMMPEARRRTIAEICRRYEVVVLEDDIYGFLPEPALTPISALVPERSVYFTSLSKSVAPALRLGFARASQETVERMARGLRATTLMVNPLTAEIGSRMIEDGTAARLAAELRLELQARQAMAAEIMAGLDMDTHPNSYHLWLKLPEPWRREAFTAEARRRGVAVAPADAFAIGRGPTPHAVRVCLAYPQDRPVLAHGLRTLAELAVEEPDPRLPIV
jgi:DNA-binding transcriptional MocR family regulator